MNKLRRAVLVRGITSDEGTFGHLTLSDGQELRTVELPWRDNAPTVSCIPPGVYRCETVHSPRFGRVYGVRDVPGRSHILFHAGNFGGDKDQGWNTDLQGCIAPALKVGMLQNRNGKAQRAGLSSKSALERLHAWGDLLPFELEIR